MTPLLEQPAQYASNRAIIIDRLQCQIGRTGKQIDQLVYELYGVTDEETCIVEEEVQRAESDSRRLEVGANGCSFLLTYQQAIGGHDAEREEETDRSLWTVLRKL